MSRLIAVVMAAGHGTRMKSSLPKVLHPACGRPLVHYPVQAALACGADEVVVVVNPATSEPVARALKEQGAFERLSFAIQETPRGTGDASRAGLEALSGSLTHDDRVLILTADAPLLQAQDLRPLLGALGDSVALSLMTFLAEDPSGYGRILRDEAGEILEIREHKDLTSEAQRAVHEVNAGFYAIRGDVALPALRALRDDNAQKEFYLTDIVHHLAREQGVKAVALEPEVLAGVNDRAQLAAVEKVLYRRIADRWAREGVTLRGDVWVDDAVVLAKDVCLEPGVRLRGKTEVGAGTLVDVGSVLTDTVVGARVTIKPYCVLTQSIVEDDVQLGPFAHLRPNSHLESASHVGNFVETKNTRIKRGAKANHLAYLGDAEVGEGANLGAGTIVCNYDGFQKRRTVIGKGAFVGSDSQLVAPVSIGEGAYVATGTTVTRDVPDGGLAIGRVRQANKEGYAAPLRARLKAAAEAAKKEPNGD